MSIVCTVLAPESERAVALAGELAERMSQPLILVDVRATSPDLLAVPQTPLAAPTPMADGLLAEAAPPPTDLERLARRAGVRPSRCDHIEAPPAAAIEALSAHPDVDLVVVSDTSGGPLAAALAAEPQRAALRDLGAPLVLVPEHEDVPALSQQLSIACAVLDDETAEVAAAAAVRLAERLDASLLFVHAGNDPDAVLRLADRIGAVVPQGMPARFESVPAEHARHLHAWAEARGADLLVTAPPRHGPVVSALLGSVVHSAARHGSVPVVVAPEAHAA